MSSSRLVVMMVVVLLMPATALALENMVIVDYLNHTSDLSILFGLVDTAGLAPVLNNPDVKYTVFAPTDQAFNELAPDDMSHILSDPVNMQTVLLGHVLDHHLTTLDIQDGGTSNSLAATPIHFNILPDYTFEVSGVKITEGDIILRNGVVHKVNGVILHRNQDGKR